MNKQHSGVIILIWKVFYPALCIRRASIFWLPTNHSSTRGHFQSYLRSWEPMTREGELVYFPCLRRAVLRLESFRLGQWVEALFLGVGGCIPLVLVGSDLIRYWSVLIYSRWATSVTSISLSFLSSYKGLRGARERTEHINKYWVCEC